MMPSDSLQDRVLAAMQKIRERNVPIAGSPQTAKGSEIWPARLDGNSTQRLIIYLRSSGCFWSIGRRRHGQPDFRPGCLDCEHSISGTTLGQPVSARNFISQFESEFDRYRSRNIPIICIYNEGNFFNEAELPAEARNAILRKAASRHDVRCVVVESLPQTITKDKLAETRSVLGDIRIEVGIGLESSNDSIRSLCVNKPYDLAAFVKSVELVKKSGMKVLAYVLLKPSFLSERQAVDDAIKTAEYAFKIGVDIVSLEPVNAGERNMAGHLERLGIHRLPWLWSVIEVARAVAPLGEFRIGGLQFAPKYIHSAYNGESVNHPCNSPILRAIDQYNSTYSLDTFSGITCPCNYSWQREMRRPLESIEARIERLLPALEYSLESYS